MPRRRHVTLEAVADQVDEVKAEVRALRAGLEEHDELGPLPEDAPDARAALDALEARARSVPKSAWRGVPKDAARNFRKHLNG